MELKIFENEKIPQEIEKFYDDLANIYLKSTYEYGVSDKKINGAAIGRYLLSELDIHLVDKNIDIGFLIYSKEGYQKQDELVMTYDKYIILNEIGEITKKYLNEVIDLTNYTYTDGKNILKKSDKFPNTMKVSLAGLIIATHKFGIRQVYKVFRDKKIYVDKDNIPITWYIDNKEYDLGFLVEDLFELIYPKYDPKKDNIKVDKDKEFVGNKTNDPKKELKKDSKILKLIENAGSKLLETGTELAKQYVIEMIKNHFKEEKELNQTENKKEKIKDRITKSENKIKKPELNKHYRVPKNETNINKVEEKFKKDYGLDNIAKYFADVTNRNIKKGDENSLNEVLKAENEKNNEVVTQDKTKEYKSIEKKQISTIEYLYNLASKSNNPLDSLEKSLKYITAKYEKNFISNTKDIVISTIKDKIKQMYIDKINKFTNDGLKNPKPNVVVDLGIVDIDEISIDVKGDNLKKIKESFAYKLIRLIKDQNLVDESFARTTFSRKYPKTRRLLDNIQLNIVKSLCGLKNENFDGVSNRDENIFCKYIIYLDEKQKGLDDYEYNMFSSIEKKANITGLIIMLIKSRHSFQEESIKFISNNMLFLNYTSYVKNNTHSIDSQKIKKIFPTFDSLEYNFNLRKALNVSLFYKSLYSEKNDIKSYYVCDGASLTCKFSGSITSLICKNTSKYIDSKNIATVENVDIIPFSNCTLTQDGVCKPHLKRWEKILDEKIDGKYVLMSSSITFCDIGGQISIAYANQNKSGFSLLEKNKVEKKYLVNDYVIIDSKFVFEFLDLFLNDEDKKIYTNENSINGLEESIYKYLKQKFKAKKDELNLENTTVIPAVNSYDKKIINLYNLKKYVKGYYLGKLKNIDIKEKDKVVQEGIKSSKLFAIAFLKKAFDRLETIYENYDVVDDKLEKKAYWMKKIHKKIRLKKDYSVYFVKYILNENLLKTSMTEYLGEIDKNYEKIDKIIYGSVIVLKNEANKYTIGFLVSKTNTGYYVIGANENGEIKKTFFKSSSLYCLLWPKKSSNLY